MELKRNTPNHHDPPSRVLIVPYGIETQEKKYSANVLFVLIVPYGIETSSSE